MYLYLWVFEQKYVVVSVGLFLSTTINKLDKKGRVSVPSGFRTALSQDTFQGVVLFQSYTQNCVEGVGMAALEAMNERLDDNFALFSDDHDDMATVIFGDSIPCGFDGDGRITLPQHLIEALNITDKIAFVGLGKKFQIWNPDDLEARKSAARKSVQSKKTTLPKGDAS